MALTSLCAWTIKVVQVKPNVPWCLCCDVLQAACQCVVEDTQAMMIVAVAAWHGMLHAYSMHAQPAAAEQERLAAGPCLGSTGRDHQERQHWA
jgi:hypothetical protein